MNGDLEAESSKTLHDDRDNNANVKIVQKLLSRYVDQILHGCGDATCTETVCATGRRNTSTRPIRDYTPRSARAIAITLASGPKPRSRLCQKYPSNRHQDTSGQARGDGPQDSSAFVQQLSDTSSVRSACDASADLSLPNSVNLSNGASMPAEPADLPIHYWRTRWIERLEEFRSLDSSTALSEILGMNTTLALDLCRCVQSLTGSLPKVCSEDWLRVNLIIQRGISQCVRVQWLNQPVDEVERTIGLLNCLNRRPFYDLFNLCLQVLNQRRLNELRVSAPISPKELMHLHSRRLDYLVVQHLSFLDFESVRAPILIWLKMMFLEHWENGCTLPKNSIADLTLRMHVWLSDSINSEHMRGLWQYLWIIPKRLDVASLAKSYLSSEVDTGSVHMLNFPSVFQTKELAMYFRSINYMRMQRTHTDSEIQTRLHERYQQQWETHEEPEGHAGYLQEHYLLLNISRQNVVQDAFDQVWQRRKSELLRPLRVRLGEAAEFEVGHDLGGVQIEFFNLLWKELLREDAGMFATDKATALSYFRPGSLQPLYTFELVGMLFGLAIYNGITLPVNFPLALYRQLTSRDPWTEPNISDRWPDVARSLQSILDQDVPGLEAVVPLEANGLRLSVLADQRYEESNGRIRLEVTEAIRIVHHQPIEPTEAATGSGKGPARGAAMPEKVYIAPIRTAWPGWRLVNADGIPAELTTDNKRDYVRSYKEWLVVGSVAPQLSAFKKGFHTIMPPLTTAFLTPAQLQTIAEGTSSFCLTFLQNNTDYENYDPQSRYIRSFWRLLASWSEKKQRQLLKFVTAIERMPANADGAAGGATGGTQGGNVIWKIERPVPDDEDQLPRSSTCFRTLYLPKYQSVEDLERMLTVALEFGGEGFGNG